MQVENHLAEGATIIAATERLARDLRVRYTLARKRAGEQVWASPNIHSMRAWMLREWGACWPDQQLLYAQQELSVWLYCIEKSGGDSLLSKTAAARQARFAGNIVERFCIDPTPGAFATRDEQAFATWYAMVQETLAEKGWIIEEQIPADLMRRLDAGEWQPEPRLHLVGFVDETQAQARLFERLGAAGTVVTRSDHLDPLNATVTAVRPANRLAQMRQAACRIRALLEPLVGRVDAEPPRIGLLVPGLDDCRSELDAVLAEYVAPYTVLPGAHRDRIPWRYARGVPLADHPLVGAAMDLLGLESRRNGVDLVSRVVMSAHTFLDFPDAAKAELDYRLRERGGTRFTLKSLRNECRRAREKESNPYATRLEGFLELYEDSAPTRALPSVWSGWIEEVLAAADWGTRNLSTGYKQALDAWRESLNALRAMDTQVREIDKARLIVWLREIVLGRPFQPAVEHLQPVQILEFEDAYGMQFDEVIVLDLTSKHMPQSVRSLGFLPTDRLAAAGVPNATPESALKRAQRWFEHIQIIAPNVTLMAPRHDDQGAGLLPSPLYTAWPQDEEGDTAICDSHMAKIMRAGVQAKFPTTETVPPVVDPLGEGVRGGVAVLKSMAVSPFVAFARHRLGLREFPSSNDGVDVQTQGRFIHKVLERFWKRTVSQSALKAMTTDELRKQVLDDIVKTQEEDGIMSPSAYGEGLAAVERERVRDLALDWLELEKARPIPFEVMVFEGRTSAKIAHLPLQLSVDRIDRLLLPDGDRYLIQDYKTASGLKASSWEPESMSEPQLPLYATFADLAPFGVPRVDGVAFAKLVEDGVGFVLLGNFADRLTPDYKGNTGTGDEGWLQRLESWRRTLEQSAIDFLAGDLRLDREKLRRSRFDRDLDPLVRPRPELPPVLASEDPF